MRKFGGERERERERKKEREILKHKFKILVECG